MLIAVVVWLQSMVRDCGPYLSAECTGPMMIKRREAEGEALSPLSSSTGIDYFLWRHLASEAPVIQHLVFL